MKKTDTSSWGRLNQSPRTIRNFDADQLSSAQNSRLPFGNGRSYGDSCHNDQGILLHNAPLGKVLSFDPDNGILHAESGVLLADILQHLRNTGWFLPVVPGTKFVTLGGAIANDIHGKNHHKRGTFGCHVQNLTLLTSDGKEHVCSRKQNQNLFSATIGGMGLTGYITRAEIKLLQVPSHNILETRTPFNCLNEFLELSEESDSKHEYCVAWIDSLASGSALGKGILIAGDHTSGSDKENYRGPGISIPFTPPIALVAGPPLKAFNLAYYHASARKTRPHNTGPGSFFFPLDAIGGWNKLYGPRGLFQHQSVLPLQTSKDAVESLIRTTQLAGHGSFLTVLKRFGDIPSPGLLSFPASGFTLTLDFPNKGAKTLKLLDDLDAICIEAGGRINPYKDARMSANTFQTGYPNWEQLEQVRDPIMMSDFWRRVTQRSALSAPPLQTSLKFESNSKRPLNQPLQPDVQKD